MTKISPDQLFQNKNLPLEIISIYDINYNGCSIHPQGVILSSFYWGYTMTQIIGGRLADQHSGEVVLWVFGLGWSLAILSITLLANWSDLLVILANFINGLSQGKKNKLLHVMYCMCKCLSACFGKKNFKNNNVISVSYLCSCCIASVYTVYALIVYCMGASKAPPVH